MTDSMIKALQKKRPGITRATFGFANITWHGVDCVSRTLEHRDLREARVFIASNYLHVWDTFKKAYDLDTDGFARSSLASGRRVQFKPSATISDGSAANTVKDIKSKDFMYDWHVLSKADIVFLHSRSTYSNAAIAFSSPRALYMFSGSGPVTRTSMQCVPLLHRDACMHDGAFYRTDVSQYGRFQDLLKSCLLLSQR